MPTRNPGRETRVAPLLELVDARLVETLAGRFKRTAGQIEEARKLLGFKSKTDTIVLSLRELIRRKRIDQIKEILGSIDLEIDLGDSRRRPRSPRSR